MITFINDFHLKNYLNYHVIFHKKKIKTKQNKKQNKTKQTKKIKLLIQ